MEAREPGASARIAGEHVEHEAHLARLAQTVEDLRAQPADARDAAALMLYRELSLFVADNFEHMMIEETHHNAVLWARYTDEELLALHHELVGSIPPQEMMFVMRWMLPFMNPAERLTVLQDIRWNAPAPVFQAVIDTARPHLTQREWEKLAAALAIA
jgi:hypothetical protein